MFGKHACTIPAALCLLGACSVYDQSLLSTNQGVGEGGSTGEFGGGGAAVTAGTAGRSIGGTSSSAGASGSGAVGSGGVAGMHAAGAGGTFASTGGSSNGGAGGTSAGTSSGGAGASSAGTGGSGAGGRVGSAGSSPGGAPSGGSGGLALDLIDDMEDDDAVINYDDGRDGDWYVGHDATAGGTQFPGINYMMSPLDSGDSRYSASDKYAAMTKGQGFTDWGENMGFNIELVDQSLGKHPSYDASKYCGIHFYGRVGSGASSEVIFRVPDKNSHPDGGVCGAADKPCYIPYQKQLAFTTSWKEYSILFTDLTRSGWGPVTFQVNAIYGVEFGLLPNTKFELWVDDISFFVKPSSGVCPTKL